jgi:hypothetical protein
MQSALRNVMLGIAAIAFTASASTASAQSANAGMGNWKLNVEKSKYSPGPAPKSLNIKFEPAGAGVKVTTDGVNADGSKSASEYTANYDGKDSPIKGSPASDTVSLVRKDANTTVRTDKKAGKVVATLTRVVAKDGKSFTVAVVGTNAKGEAVNHMLVWDKQ